MIRVFRIATGAVSILFLLAIANVLIAFRDGVPALPGDQFIEVVGPAPAPDPDFPSGGRTLRDLIFAPLTTTRVTMIRPSAPRGMTAVVDPAAPEPPAIPVEAAGSAGNEAIRSAQLCAIGNLPRELVPEADVPDCGPKAEAALEAAVSQTRR